jgi:hypothetical protein
LINIRKLIKQNPLWEKFAQQLNCFKKWIYFRDYIKLTTYLFFIRDSRVKPVGHKGWDNGGE